MSALSRTGFLRQGDVLLIPVARVPEGATASESGSRLVLAEGEATGHAHAVLAEAAELAESPDGTLYLSVAGPSTATLVHDEHDPIPLEPGAYQVVRQREYEPRPQAPARTRWVAD